MRSGLAVSIGQHSDKGRKAANQDFHGAALPDAPGLAAKGVALAVADGISSSEVSHAASEAAVRSFLTDYYCTSDAWSVSRSAQRVLTAANAWLHAQTQRGSGRFDKDRGYVCTFSALVLRSTTAHVFHVGDTRVCRWHSSGLEPLTEDHRVWIGGGQSYLARALGMGAHVEIDYRAVAVERGDVFLLSSDGVHEHVDAAAIGAALAAHPDDLDAAAWAIVEAALQRGSPDNLTVQIVRIDALPEGELDELQAQRAALPWPPQLAPRMRFDGYTIVRELHHSHRSHICLAVDDDTGEAVVLKTPSVDLQNDEALLDRFLLEDWVARRIDSAHVLKPHVPPRRRNHLYVAMEFVDGQTLAQWMVDNPRPTLETVRGIVEQLARGLQAFHRLEMLHQDLRPENVMIDHTGTVRIIDFGSAWVAGLDERTPADPGRILGTVQYTAPEYFLGEGGSARSDLFSLAVIVYQMLTGRLPYGAEVARTVRTRADLRRLQYRSALGDPQRPVPAWIDEVLRKALHPSPLKRHQALSEFVEDLRRPRAEFLNRRGTPLVEKNPLMFWKCATLASSLALIALLGVISLRG
ncbi:serine/threonine protein phosphatase PrpC [Variovorax sp. TBS-050B]|uniref:bifunctional protein-serine/threonine kinase/phosphatase n=1 Tax=Variovorax sp. TBS-050B TaxID=2940551 RepID=UPI0024730AE2|nr:bifunctional protein-serine/threonine kinase/phosphatase [Variovorax sp. TBS-050B]MDH6594354.1 serine/threonine protein phosphatase PrpC [Variovorax sp. TBS-050B]